MLKQETKDIIKQAFSNVKTNMPDFVVRFAQNQMIAQISNTLAHSNEQSIACIEAPTGIGKTLSYLLSGIPIALAKEKKLIISTATVALQEQLVNKDLPDVQKYSQLDFSFALIKGRGRYVCIRNLSHLANSNNQASLFEQDNMADDGINKQQRSKLVRLERDYNNQTWDGESDTLEKPLEPQIWQKIQCNHSNCSNKQCEFYSRCCFFNTRKHIFNADVLVANHDLVLADLISGNTALPEPNQTMYIFDEAHHLGAKSLNHFANHLSLHTLDIEIKNQKQWVEYLAKIQNNEALLTDFKQGVGQLLAAKLALVKQLENYLFEEDIFLFTLGVIDENYAKLAEQVFAYLRSLSHLVEQLSEQFEQDKKQQTMDGLAVESIQTKLSQAQQFYNGCATLFHHLLTPDPDNSPPISRWIVKKPLANNQQDYILHTAKIDISSDLQTLLWHDCYGAVLTSATLSSLGNFARINNQLGINNENTQYLRLASPFDYNNVPFIIANLTSFPNSEFYNQEVATELLARIDQTEGSLVLFTSYVQMQAVTSLIEHKLSIGLLLQGEYSKQMILDKHKILRDAGQGSIIFGLDSFYEGVDLPRHYLTHVIIIKLRFNVPNSPIEKTTQAYLSKNHQNAFYQTSLPDASLKLIQASGRLIRSEYDTGKITIFDTRLVKKNYGKQLLSSLPDYKIVVE